MIRMQVYIPDQLFTELKHYSRAQRVAMSEVIRKGLKEVLPSFKNKTRRSKKRKRGEGFVGALNYGPKDLSTQINDIYK